MSLLVCVLAGITIICSTVSSILSGNKFSLASPYIPAILWPVIYIITFIRMKGKK